MPRPRTEPRAAAEAAFAQKLSRRAWRLLLPALAAALLGPAAGCGGDPPRPPLPRRVVDLSPPLQKDLALRQLGQRALEFLGTDGLTHLTPVLPEDPALAFGWARLEVFSHAGSHLDAPNRLLRGGEPPALVPVDKLSGPARVADLRWHDRNSPIEIADLEPTPIRSGDIVVLLVGYEPPAPDRWPAYPGISAQVAEWLVAKNVRAVATDMPALVPFERLADRMRKGLPAGATWAEYVPFFQAQTPVIAGLVNLGALAGEERVLLVAAPLPVMDATGAPARVVALVY